MQIRTFFRGAYLAIVGFLLALSAVPPISAMQGLHYGVRTDTFQPIHLLSNWLWYSHFHTQVPSFDKIPQFWLVSVGTGARGVLTPYFTFGFYISGGQLQNRLGKSYLINPGVECFFPWAKLGIHGYFMNHQVPSGEKIRPIEESALVKHAIDVKLSGTFLPFVRPFFAVYYLSRFSHSTASHHTGPLHVNWGIEWLMAPKCSLELQHEIGQGSFWMRLKIHSAKVYKPSRETRVIHYLKEPIDQYTLPIMLLSPDSQAQEAFWSAEAAQVAGVSRQSVEPPDGWNHYGAAFHKSGSKERLSLKTPVTDRPQDGMTPDKRGVQFFESTRKMASDHAPPYLPNTSLPNDPTIQHGKSTLSGRVAELPKSNALDNTLPPVELAGSTPKRAQTVSRVKASRLFHTTSPTSIPQPSQVVGNRAHARRHSTGGTQNDENQNSVIVPPQTQEASSFLRKGVDKLLGRKQAEELPLKLVTNPEEDTLTEQHPAPDKNSSQKSLATQSIAGSIAKAPSINAFPSIQEKPKEIVTQPKGIRPNSIESPPGISATRRATSTGKNDLHGRTRVI